MLARYLALCLTSVFSFAHAQLAVTNPAAAQNPDNCSSVLVPTVEQSMNDYSLIQAYMSVNSSSEYARLENMDSKNREGQASYKSFGAEFQEAKVASRFEELVKKRLESEGFYMTKNSAASHYRRGISDDQAKAWLACKEAGGLILSAQAIEGNRFFLVASYRPPRGVGSAELTIDLAGGQIDRRSKLNYTFTGSEVKSWIVQSSSDSSTVHATGNVPGYSDQLVVQLDHKPQPILAGQYISSECFVGSDSGSVQLSVDIQNLDGSSHNFGRWVSAAPDQWVRTPRFDFSTDGLSGEYVAGARWRCTTSGSATDGANCRLRNGDRGQVELQLAILDTSVTPKWPAGSTWQSVPAKQKIDTPRFSFSIAKSAGAKRAAAEWQCLLR